MGNAGGKYTQGGYIPQELLKELSKINNRLVIGIPCERKEDEKRLILTPEAVEFLSEAGHHVMMETGAGIGINYADNHYSEAGAEIVQTPAEVFDADIILKIMPPLPSEVALMRPRSTLFSFVPLNLFTPEAFEGLMAKRITALAYDLMKDERNSSPIMCALDEIEGTASIMIAASMLSSMQGGKGILLGGIPGVPPTEVIIIGAGTAGSVAARAAIGLGAQVKVFDEDIHKLRCIQQELGQMIFTSNFHPNVLHNAFISADLVIGAMGETDSHQRYIVSEELIQKMKKGSLIIDLMASQGGCFETTCGLPHNHPEIFEQYGVTHYCKPCISNYVARTTAMAFSNIFAAMLLKLGDAGSTQHMIKLDESFRSGIYMYTGKPVNNYVSGHFNILSNNLDIYLSVF